MSIRIYFMPITGSGTPDDGRRPKYADTDLATVSWSMMDYGNEPFCIVAADVTPTQHTTLVAHPDVLSPPANLDLTLGSNLATVQSAFETAHLPAGWMSSGTTYRTVVRVAAAACLFLQRIQGIYGGRVFDSGITLDTTFSQLPSGVRQHMLNAADEFNFDTSSLSGSSTLRQIVKAMADQWPQLGIHLGGQVF